MENLKNFLASRVTIAVLISWLMLSPNAGAQSFTGTITGTLTDPSGRVVPNAFVTVTRVETNRRTTAMTGNDGVYRVTALGLGEYRVEAAAPGFKMAVRTGITLELNQTAVINFPLEGGAATERVEVVADAALLESTTSDVGKVVDNRRIMELPVNTRNVFSLINLTPGARARSGMTVRRGPCTERAPT